jgi:Nuclease-related domain
MASKEVAVRRAHTMVGVALVLLSTANFFAWMTQPSIQVVAGAALAAFLVYRTIAGGSKTWFLGLAYFILAFGGMANIPRGNVALVHGMWAFWFIAGVITRTILARGQNWARISDQKRDQQQLEQERITANRQAHLDYAARVEREQKFQTHASRPGTTTGFEPAALEGYDAAMASAPHLYGKPGAGLAGSGFDQAAIERGAEGERNFARALAKAGLLDRYATFWSVHMPSEGVGASDFTTDIDCVVVTGRSVWLVDMKNYNQGDVVWSSEKSSDDQGKEQQFLIAVDRATGGLVGGKRKMSLNMKMATDVFTRRFADTGLKFLLKPAVVLMPRDGLGEIRNVRWAGDIPTAGLPEFFSWLAAEPPFDLRNPDAAFVVSMLRPLLKDESGSAWRPGRPLRAQAPAKVAAPSTAATTAPTAAAVADDALRCSECDEVVESDQTFCYSCGASV